MSRTRRSRTGAAATKKAAPKSFGRTGRQGLDEAKEEAERIAERRVGGGAFAPFRFWMKQGTEREIIILDESLDDAFFCYEHGLQDSNGKWGREHSICVKEHENCPLCSASEDEKSGVGRSYYVMFLTILDLDPYVNKQGEEIPYTKKLMAVKGTQINEFAKTLEKAEENNGTIRGLYMVMSRGNETNSASIGTPTILDNEKLYDLVPEEELEEDYWNEAVVNEQSGAVYKEEGSDIEPFDYAELFEYPDVDELARKYSKRHRSAGSQSDIEDEWAEGEEEAEEDEAPKRTRRSKRGAAKSEEKTTRTRRSKAAPRAKPREDEEEDAEEPPPRVRSRRKKASEDEEDEAPKKRTRGKPKPKTRTRSRKTADQVEDDGEEDEIPF